LGFNNQSKISISNPIYIGFTLEIENPCFLKEKMVLKKCRNIEFIAKIENMPYIPKS
jgi:hypothetical protein